MNVECFVEIPAGHLREAIEAAYDLSVPQGMDFLHARQGPLDDATVDAIIARDRGGHIAAAMDYVHGRACKMTIWRHEGRLFADPRWFDHTRAQLVGFLEALGIAEADAKIEAAIKASAAEAERGHRAACS